VARIVGIVVAVLLVMGIPVAQAQGDEQAERARFNVEAWLKQELGKSGMILVNYSYAGSSWEDSAMGCPVEGQTYTPGTVNGYSWTFLFDNMVRYEVHSNLDGTQAVLCSSVSASSNIQLTPYQALNFSILSPEAWLIFSNAGQTTVLFAPQQQITCALPGMRVTVVGRIASGITPDQLLDEYLSQAGAQDNPADRSTIGSFGRSTLFQSACENASRQWRVSMFVQYGTAYRVEQWAPADVFSQWAQAYLDMLSQFVPGNSTPAPEATAAPDTASDSSTTLETPGAAEVVPLELAALPMAHLFVGDVFIGTLNAIPGRSITSVPTLERRYLTFSPDGLFLAFTDVTDAQIRALNAAQGLSARLVAEDVDPRFPPAWSPDSQEIAFVVAAGQTDAGTALEIRAATRDGSTARTLGTFTFGGDCPTTLTDPADKPYFQEAGQIVFHWLPGDRVIISSRCDGGLSLLNLADGQITDLGSDLDGGAVSPDGARFLARTETGVALIDVTTGQRTDLTVGQGAQQIAWGPDGNTIFYATETLADSITLDTSPDQSRAEEIFGLWPVSFGMYTLSLVRLDLSTQAEQVIWQGQGRGVGKIAVAPDGSGVLFSVIQSSLMLAEAFQTGTDPRSARELWPGPQLYWLPTDGTTATLLAYSGQPVFAPITVQPVPPEEAAATP